MENNIPQFTLLPGTPDWIYIDKRKTSNFLPKPTSTCIVLVFPLEIRYFWVRTKKKIVQSEELLITSLSEEPSKTLLAMNIVCPSFQNIFLYLFFPFGVQQCSTVQWRKEAGWINELLNEIKLQEMGSKSQKWEFPDCAGHGEKLNVFHLAQQKWIRQDVVVLLRPACTGRCTHFAPPYGDSKVWLFVHCIILRVNISVYCS